MKPIPANAKACNRETAFSIISALYDGTQPTDAQLQSVLLYFAPAVSSAKTYTDPRKWVAQFVAVKDARRYINWLYSDGKRLMGTNGHTGAWTPTDMPAGFYCPKTFRPGPTEDEIGKFPDMDRVLPKKSGKPFELAAELGPLTLTGKYNSQDVRDARFNAEYLTWALRGGDATVTSLDAHQNSPVRIETKLGTCVIMRMRK